MTATLLAVSAFIALAVAITRLLLGPTQADRVVALDVVFASSLALAGAAALASDQFLYLDIAIGLATVGFVATIAWSRIIERPAPREEQ